MEPVQTWISWAHAEVFEHGRHRGRRHPSGPLGLLEGMEKIQTLESTDPPHHEAWTATWLV